MSEYESNAPVYGMESSPKKVSLFGQNLSRLLVDKHMSVLALAQLSGVASSSIFKLISGENQNPRVLTVEKLCRALDVKKEYFFTIHGDDTPTESPPSIKEIEYKGPPISEEVRKVILTVPVIPLHDLLTADVEFAKGLKENDSDFFYEVLSVPYWLLPDPEYDYLAIKAEDCKACAPEVTANTVLIITNSETAHDGDLVVAEAQVAGRKVPVARRLIREDTGEESLLATNPEYYGTRLLKCHKIYGKVIAKIDKLW